MNRSRLKETRVLHETERLKMNIYHNHSQFYCHWHDELEFLYVLDGCCNCIVNGTSYTVEEGDLLFIECGALHSKNEFPRALTISVVIHPQICGAECLNYFDKSISYERVLRHGTKTTDSIIKNILAVNECFETRGFGYELRLKSLIADTFALMLENGYYKIRENRLKTNEAFEEILSFIHSEYASPISLDTLAEKANYSRSYTIRIFKKYTGKTPLEYTNDYRLSKSAELLQNTDMSVLDIALECGFENVGYYIVLFKKRFGTTPLKWRLGRKNIQGTL